MGLSNLLAVQKAWAKGPFSSDLGWLSSPSTGEVTQAEGQMLNLERAVWILAVIVTV